MCGDVKNLKIKLMRIFAKRPSQKEGAEAVIELMNDEGCRSGRDRMMVLCQFNTLDVLARVGSGNVINTRKAIFDLALNQENYAVLAREEGIDWLADEIMSAVASCEVEERAA